MGDVVTQALAGIGPEVAAFAVTAVFVAAIVRGFAGFGMSLLVVAALSVVLPPVAVVPMSYFLEIVASLQMLPSTRRDVHWRSFMPISLGMLALTPVGFFVLTTLPADPMRLVIAGAVFCGAVALWRRPRERVAPTAPMSLFVGSVSGLLNGSVGMAGAPVSMFYLMTPLTLASARASVIAYILVATGVGAVGATLAGIVDDVVLTRAALLAIVVLAGNWIGAHAFRRTDAARARAYILALIVLMAAALAVRAVAA